MNESQGIFWLHGGLENVLKYLQDLAFHRWRRYISQSQCIPQIQSTCSKKSPYLILKIRSEMTDQNQKPYVKIIVLPHYLTTVAIP